MNDPKLSPTGLASLTGFVLSIEEFANGFVVHGLFGLVASDKTREGAIEKLRKLTVRTVEHLDTATSEPPAAALNGGGEPPLPPLDMQELVAKSDQHGSTQYYKAVVEQRERQLLASQRRISELESELQFRTPGNGNYYVPRAMYDAKVAKLESELTTLRNANKKLLEALELIYDKYEEGVGVFEDVETLSGNLGNAVRLSEAEEKQILEAFEAAGVETALTYSKRHPYTPPNPQTGQEK